MKACSGDEASLLKSPGLTQYSGRSLKCRSFDGLRLFFDFQLLKSSYLNSRDRSERTNCNWYQYHFHVPLKFFVCSLVRLLITLFFFFDFQSVVNLDRKVDYLVLFFFFFFFSFVDYYLFCCTHLK